MPALPAVLAVRFIGYHTAEVAVPADGPRVLDVRLAPSTLELEGLVVTGENPAERIMRRVIEEKQAWRARLGPVASEGFTRIVLENERGIVLVAESVFDAYRDPERGPREVVRSRRRTGTLHERFGLHDAGRVPDLYDDVVALNGLDFLGPTHPDALDLYTFTLARRRALDGRTVFDLYVAPKTFLQPTFMGRVSVLDSVFAVVEAELRPAPHVDFPAPTAAWDVFYTQQFAPVGDAWLPVDLRAEGRIAVRPGGVPYAPARYRQVSRFTDYRRGADLPAAPYAGAERVTVDSAAVLQDYLFLRGRDVVPLTPDEERALYALRGDPPTLDEAFRPVETAWAALAALRANDGDAQFRWPRYKGYAPWLWYDRVDGAHLGVSMLLPVSARLTAEVRAAQTSAGGRIRYRAFGTYRLAPRLALRAERGADSAVQGTGSHYARALASVPPLLGGDDYFDLYWNERTHLEAAYERGGVRAAVGLRAERHEAMERAVGRGWPFGQAFRPNPAVPEGALRSVVVRAGVGDPYRPLRTEGARGAHMEVEHAGALGGDFSFLRADLTADARLNTFARGRVRPNALDVRLRAGAAAGTVPPQRYGLVDGALGGFAPFGTLRTLRGRPYAGARHAAVFWAHDFRTLPFEALRLRPLVSLDMGVRVFGGHARTWTPGAAPSLHHEIGASLTRVLGLPVRLDVARRLDRPGWAVGFGVVSRLER